MRKLITDERGAKVSARPDLRRDQGAHRRPRRRSACLYFAGHGVNINRSEHWLLTDAPEQPAPRSTSPAASSWRAIAGSARSDHLRRLPRRAGRHPGAERARPVDVFPNDGAATGQSPSISSSPACWARPRPRSRTRQVAASNFTALYTDALLDALRASAPTSSSCRRAGDSIALHQAGASSRAISRTEMPQRVMALELENKVNQNPDAIITSHTALGLAYRPRRLRAPPRTSRGPAPAGAAPGARRSRIDSLRATTRRARALGGRRRSVGAGAQITRAAARPDAARRRRSGRERRADCGAVRPRPFRNRMRHQGSRRAHRRISLHARAGSSLLGAEGDLAASRQHRRAGRERAAAIRRQRRHGDPRDPRLHRGADVRRRRARRRRLRAVGQQLALGPLQGSRANEVRALRALAASSSHHGRFRLDARGRDRDRAARCSTPRASIRRWRLCRLRLSRPAGHRRAFARCRTICAATSAATFFDLALLARAADRQHRSDAETIVVPFVPLLGAGLGAARREPGASCIRRSTASRRRCGTRCGRCSIAGPRRDSGTRCDRGGPMTRATRSGPRPRPGAQGFERAQGRNGWKRCTKGWRRTG